MGLQGHVFVVRGDLAGLHCDARIVPAEYRRGVHTAPRDRWYLDDAERDRAHAASAPTGWKRDDVRCYPVDPGDSGGPTLWITKVGLDTPEDYQYAMDSASAYLDLAAVHATTHSAKGDSTDKQRRELPLLAMHIPGSGASNAKVTLGKLVPAIVKMAEECVAKHAVDVAIVVRDAAQYAALQAERHRRGDTWRLLRAVDMECIQRIVSPAEGGRRALSVFIGAGVSMAAGLPGWKKLLEGLAEDFGMAAEIYRDPIEAKANRESSAKAELQIAKKLVARVGKEKLAERIRVRCTAPRPSLAHYLLANLPAREYVTLNYDTLLERACKLPGSGQATDRSKLDVLLHQLREGTFSDRAWLLKLHGCVEGSAQEIVLTDDDYQMVRDRRSAFNGLVQGLLLTRHMLFVGFGMNDPNVENLVLDLEKAISDARVPTHPKLGTVLQISDKSEPLKPPPEQPPPPPQIDWSKRFHVQDLVDTGEPTGVGARRSELLLDALVAHTSERHAHLLDEDFEGLFSDAEQRARVKAQKFAEELRAIEPSDARDKMLTMLGQFGLRVAQASDTRVRDRRRTTRKSRGG